MPKKNPERLNLGGCFQRSQVVRTDFISTGRGCVGERGSPSAYVNPNGGLKLRGSRRSFGDGSLENEPRDPTSTSSSLYASAAQSSGGASIERGTVRANRVVIAKPYHSHARPLRGSPIP